MFGGDNTTNGGGPRGFEALRGMKGLFVGGDRHQEFGRKLEELLGELDDSFSIETKSPGCLERDLTNLAGFDVVLVDYGTLEEYVRVSSCLSEGARVSGERIIESVQDLRHGLSGSIHLSENREINPPHIVVLEYATHPHHSVLRQLERAEGVIYAEANPDADLGSIRAAIMEIGRGITRSLATFIEHDTIALQVLHRGLEEMMDYYRGGSLDSEKLETARRTIEHALKHAPPKHDLYGMIDEERATNELFKAFTEYIVKVFEGTHQRGKAARVKLIAEHIATNPYCRTSEPYLNGEYNRGSFLVLRRIQGPRLFNILPDVNNAISRKDNDARRFRDLVFYKSAEYTAWAQENPSSPDLIVGQVDMAARVRTGYVNVAQYCDTLGSRKVKQEEKRTLEECIDLFDITPTEGHVQYVDTNWGNVMFDLDDEAADFAEITRRCSEDDIPEAAKRRAKSSMVGSIDPREACLDAIFVAIDHDKMDLLAHPGEDIAHNQCRRSGQSAEEDEMTRWYFALAKQRLRTERDEGDLEAITNAMLQIKRDDYREGNNVNINRLRTDARSLIGDGLYESVFGLEADIVTAYRNIRWGEHILLEYIKEDITTLHKVEETKRTYTKEGRRIQFSVLYRQHQREALYKKHNGNISVTDKGLNILNERVKGNYIPLLEAFDEWITTQQQLERRQKDLAYHFTQAAEALCRVSEKYRDDIVLDDLPEELRSIYNFVNLRYEQPTDFREISYKAFETIKKHEDNSEARKLLRFTQATYLRGSLLGKLDRTSRRKVVVKSQLRSYKG